MEKTRGTFHNFRATMTKHKKLPVKEERKLIYLAKRGDRLARDKLLLHLVGFMIFRIQTSISYPTVVAYGEDILQECILFADINIQRYKIRFKNKAGIYKTYCLSTYLWKGITGTMFAYIKKNCREKRRASETEIVSKDEFYENE